MGNTLGCYSTKNNTSIQLSSDKCGSFIVNGEYILYKNLDDNSSLYIIKKDGSGRRKDPTTIKTSSRRDSVRNSALTRIIRFQLHVFRLCALISSLKQALHIRLNIRCSADRIRRIILHSTSETILYMSEPGNSKM